MFDPSTVRLTVTGPVEGPTTLRDGENVVIRPVRDDDREGLREFVAGVSDGALARRYFGAVRPERVLESILAGAHDPDGLSLVMESRSDGRPRLVALAEYRRDGPTSPGAEAAFLVTESYQGRGCATLLLERLARAAVGHGIVFLHAIVLSENFAMVDVFRGCGLPLEERWGTDALHFRIYLPIGGGAVPRPLAAGTSSGRIVAR